MDENERIEYLECALRDAHNETNKLQEAIADRDRQIQELVARYEWGQQLIEELKAQRDK
jgi:hypothetical protein